MPDQQPADQSTAPSFPEGAEKQVDGTDILVAYLDRVAEAADSEKEAVRICTTVCNTDGRLKPEKEVFLDGVTLAMKEYYRSGQLLSNAEYYESSNVTYHEYTTSCHD